MLTAHYLEEAEALCDRIAMLKGGRVVALGHHPGACWPACGEADLEDAFVRIDEPRACLGSAPSRRPS